MVHFKFLICICNLVLVIKLFAPYKGIVPRGGQFPPALEEIAPYVVVGPMVRYATDLKLMLSALIGREATQRLQLYAPVIF